MLIGGIFRSYAFKSLSLGSSLNCFPFDVNSKTQKITRTTSKIRFYGWIFNILACVITLLVSTYRLLTNKSFTVKKLSHLSETASPQEFKSILETGTAVIMAAVGLYLHTAMIFVYREVPGVFTQILGYEMYFREKYASRESLKKRRSRRDVIGILLAAFYYLQLIMGAYGLIFMLTNPESEIQVLQLYPDHDSFYADGAKRLINCGVVLYLSLTFMAITLHWVLFHGFIVIFVIKIVAEISDVPEKTIGENKTRNERAYWSRDLLRYPHATVKTYRELQILLKISYDVGYASLLISQVTVYTFIVAGLYVGIRTDNVELKIMSFNSAMNNLLLFFLECVLFDKVYKSSRGFLDNWLLRDCAQMEVKVMVQVSPRRRRSSNIVAHMETVTEAHEEEIHVIENEELEHGGEIQISILAREWMKKSHKSFKPLKINLGLLFADDTDYTVNGLLCIVGNLIDLLVTF